MENEKPNLIVLDIMLPVVDGIDITRRIRENSNIPIIIVTTKDQETDRVWGMRQGAKDYVTKPVDAADLLAKVKAVL